MLSVDELLFNSLRSIIEIIITPRAQPDSHLSLILNVSDEAVVHVRESFQGRLASQPRRPRVNYPTSDLLSIKSKPVSNQKKENRLRISAPNIHVSPLPCSAARPPYYFPP